MFGKIHPDLQDLLNEQDNELEAVRRGILQGGGSSQQAHALNVNQPDTIGKYIVKGLLGEGQFGRVFLAHDADLECKVAIKVPQPERISCPRDCDNYISEARNVAKLDHPRIVPVYYVGRTDNGLPFVVSKYIPGSSLRRYGQQKRLLSNESASLVALIAEALHHAHLHDLVHRDVKPDNILIDADEKPWITDFGLALKDEDFGKGPKIAGSPAYMSPEQVRGESHRVDGRSDIFSLGVVFYELLCRRQPFRGTTRAELFDQIVNTEPRPPRSIDDTIPAELERICLKALSKHCVERYSTAIDLAEELNRFLQNARWSASAVPSSRAVGLDIDARSLMADPSALVNAQLGSYHLRKMIGQGGTGFAYLGVHAKTGKQACIKVFHPALGLPDNFMIAVRRALRGIASLDHPGIAGIFDFDRVRLHHDVPSFYIAMQYVPGRNLKDRRFLWKQTLPIAIGIAEALQAAHQCTYLDETGFQVTGIMHGDVKPSNIILGKDRSPVVIDFMMVDVQRLLNTRHRLDEEDITTTLYGTPGYMAPEQKESGVVTVQTDIYGLGCTVQDLCFPSDSTSDQFPRSRLGRRALDERKCTRRTIGRHLHASERLLSLVRRMLSEDPTGRPQSMEEVVAELREILLETNNSGKSET